MIRYPPEADIKNLVTGMVTRFSSGGDTRIGVGRNACYHDSIVAICSGCFANSIIISVEKQMQLHQDKGSKGYELVSPKNGRSRTIAAAQTVLTRLQQQHRWQMQQKLLLGSDWQNPEGLVFTNEFGTHLTKPTVYREYKRIVAAIGCPNARFHDLHHSYAVAAIRAGDDIKTVQGNLGHATAAFTLDVYGHVTDQMKRESADRMERFIRTVSAS